MVFSFTSRVVVPLVVLALCGVRAQEVDALLDRRAAALPTNVVTSTQPAAYPPPAPTMGPTNGQPVWDLSSLATTNNGPLTLDISLTGGNATSDLLYGLMLEDIDHSIDGGLYAETISNRAFQFGTLSSWLAVGGSSISLTTSNPLTSALPSSLQLSLSKQGYGFENTGYWGFNIQPQVYTLSFYAKTTKSKSFKVEVALKSASAGTVWAQETVTLNSTGWTQYTTTLIPTSSAPDENNVFTLTSAEPSQSDTVQFQLISLMPPTYNNRPNGVRPDLMASLQSLQPKYCRVPGGNNIEGTSIATRWIWNQTVGPLQNRPGREGDWGYYNTDGFGLMEWMEFCEDLGAEILLDVYAGFSLDGSSVDEEDLGPYIQEVLDEIEYLVGDSSTKYGAQRIANGRAAPVNLTYVEIGNEDFFSTTYYYRFPAYYDAIHSAYPHLQLIATTVDGVDLPSGVLWDQHQYGDPSDFEGLFSAYDNYPRGNGTPVLVGEYSVQRDMNQSFVEYGTMESAVAEAVYRIGLERNADVVVSGMFAPFLANLHANQEHKPRLLEYSNSPSSLLYSTSYHALSLFSTTHPSSTLTLPVTANIGFHPLYWVATSADTSSAIYVKLANAGASAQQVTLNIPGTAGYGITSATVVSGGQYAANTPSEPDNVVPESLGVNGRCLGSGTSFNMPGWSVAVITLAPIGDCGGSSASSTASTVSAGASSVSASATAAAVSDSGDILIRTSSSELAVSSSTTATRSLSSSAAALLLAGAATTGSLSTVTATGSSTRTTAGSTTSATKAASTSSASSSHAPRVPRLVGLGPVLGMVLVGLAGLTFGAAIF